MKRTTTAAAAVILTGLGACTAESSGPSQSPLSVDRLAPVFEVRQVQSPDGTLVTNDEVGDSELAEAMVEEGSAGVTVEVSGGGDGRLDWLTSVRETEYGAPPSDAELVRHGRSRAARSPVPARNKVVGDLLEAGDSDDTVSVIVSFEMGSDVGSPTLHDRMAAGGVTSAHLGDPAVRAIRQQLAAEQIAARKTEMRPMVDAVATALGTDEVALYGSAGAALFQVRRGDIPRITDLPSVRLVQEDGPVEQLQIDGEQAIYSAQVEQYLLLGYGGSGVRLGVIDLFFEDDFESIGDTRVVERWSCSSSSCTSLADLNSPLDPAFPPFVADSRHGTIVAQTAAGLPPGSAGYAWKRGGTSHATELVLIALTNVSGFLKAVDRFRSSGVDIVSSSLASTTLSGGDACTGVLAGSTAVDQAARFSSVLWLQAAGNSGNSGSTCTVRDPAGAAWSVAVGALMEFSDVADSASNYATVQSANIASYSSRGGHPYLGGTRSVIDTVAVGSQIYQPFEMPNQYSHLQQGTSFAQPLVAGAASDMLHWWRVNYASINPFLSTFIEDPGATIAQILLMGDRQNTAGGTLSYGMDIKYGSGRFRSRLWMDPQYFGNYGMDPPWKMGMTSFYVYDGSSVNYAINGGAAIPAGADRLSVAIFWPEENQDVGGADIVMDVTTTCGTSFTRSDWTWDTRKRAYITGSIVDGQCWRGNRSGGCRA